MYKRNELRRVLRGAIWGLAAAIAMGAFMLIGSAAGGSSAQRPFPALIVSQALGHRGGAGVGLLAVVAHLAYGALAGMAFAYFSRPMTLAKGIGYGIFLWFAMMVTFVPWLGWYDFGLRRGPGFQLYALVLHLIYGAVLGQLGARDEREHAAAFDDLGRLEPFHRPVLP
jgi:hypothetical protein